MKLLKSRPELQKTKSLYLNNLTLSLFISIKHRVFFALLDFTMFAPDDILKIHAK